MNLRGRIQALERKAAEAGYGQRCPECGGPLPGYDSLVFLDVEHRDLTPRCPECGSGLTAVPDAPPTSTASPVPVVSKVYIGIDPRLV